MMKVFSDGFCHVERMENERIVKRVYVRECAGSCSVGRPWKKVKNRFWEEGTRLTIRFHTKWEVNDTRTMWSSRY